MTHLLTLTCAYVDTSSDADSDAVVHVDGSSYADNGADAKFDTSSDADIDADIDIDAEVGTLTWMQPLALEIQLTNTEPDVVVLVVIIA